VPRKEIDGRRMAATTKSVTPRAGVERSTQFDRMTSGGHRTGSSRRQQDAAPAMPVGRQPGQAVRVAKPGGAGQGIDELGCPADDSLLDRPWLTVQQVADLLQVSRDTAERWIHSGDLRAFDMSARRGRTAARPTWRISRAELANFMETRATRPRSMSTPRKRRRDPGVIEFIK